MTIPSPLKPPAASALTLDNVLDVTLRDGGYLNRWRFSNHEVSAVLEHVHDTGVRRIEIGFLRAPAASTSNVDGCPAAFLRRLAERHPRMHLVAMLNPADSDWRQAIDGKLAYLSLVRLTCTANLLDRALMIAAAIRALPRAPEVSVNLICISSYTHDEVADLVKRVGGSSAVQRIYFADSRGALTPAEVPPLIALARRHCTQLPGFHAHDTRGFAVENSLCAFAHGCDLVDVSLNGFGLAGGNTSFSGLLTAAALADPGIDARTRAFCADELSLRHAPSDDRELFQVLAERNLDPIWGDALREAHPNGLVPLLRTLPRRTYQTLDQALEALTQASGADAYRRCA